MFSVSFVVDDWRMDLDQTQAIVLEDYHDETDEEKDGNEKKPVSIFVYIPVKLILSLW